MRTSILLCLLFQSAVMAPAAAVVYVDQSAPDGGDGTSWAAAFNTLQPAIDAAYARGEEMWVAMGDYDELRVVEPGSVPNWPPEDSGALVMLPGVEMYGGFAGDETERDARDWQDNETIINGIRALDGQGACHVVFGAEGAVLDGFTVTGARLTLDKGCLNVGGGMVNFEASATVRNCRFADNLVEGTAGGMFNGFSAPLIEDCVFEANGSTNGGAVYNDNAAPMINRCRFLENRAFGFRNTNAIGGAVSNYNSTPVIVNSTFWKNLAESPFGIASRGGGVYSSNTSSVLIVNSTFYGNVATNDFPETSSNFGGGVFAEEGSPTALVNSILWNNIPDQVFGEVTAVFSNIEGGYAGTGNINADPLFVNADAGDLRLLPGSPSIDTGTADGAPDVDIRLASRPQGAGFDMGAYETVAPVEPELTASFEFTPNFGRRPLLVQFTDTTTANVPVTSWYWRFGDGSTSTEQNPAHIYKVPGLFSVTLTVTADGLEDTYAQRYAILVTNKNKIPKPWLLRWLFGEDWRDWMMVEKTKAR